MVCASRLCGLEKDESTVTENRTRLDSGRFRPVFRKLPMMHLSLLDGIWELRYIEAFKAQSRLLPIVCFPDIDRVYRSGKLWPFFPSGYRASLDQKFSARFAKSISTTTMSLPCCADSVVRAWLIRLSFGPIPTQTNSWEPISFSESTDAIPQSRSLSTILSCIVNELKVGIGVRMNGSRREVAGLLWKGRSW